MFTKINQLQLLLMFVILGWSQNLHAQVLTFTLGDESAAAGATVVVPVSVDSFLNIAGYQGTFTWDTTVLDFVSLASPTAGISNIFGNPGQGIIPLNAATFAWVDFSGGGVTLPDSSIVMEITFQIKSTAATGTYPVIMDGSLTSLGYSIGTGILPPIVNQGSVTVIGCVPTTNASFTFPVSACQNGLNPLPVITGDPGGTFSVNQGASINPASGELDLTTTQTGPTYTITYSVGSGCPAIATQTFQVLAPDNAAFSVSDTLCANGISPVPTLTGLTGGTFSVDNGALIDAVTGELDLSSTTAGITYLITYQTNGACPNTDSQTVHVQAADDAGFTIADTVCTGGIDPLAVVTGLTGGLFSVNNGASIDPVSGSLDLSTTLPNTAYSISYQTQGNCPATGTQSLFVADSLDASFSYPASLCPGSPNPIATLTGTSGGIFSISPGATLNPTTGELDLSTTTQDVVYTLTYSLNDVCQSSSQQQIVIEDLLAPDSLVLPDLVGECSVSVPIPTTTDNCAGLISGTTQDSLSYSTQGSFVINWTFDDGNGNQTALSQTVIVQDTTPPVVICQDTTIQLNANGLATLLPAQLDNGSTDVCGPITLALSQDSFTLADLGQNLIYLIATDAQGNADSCLANVTVIDVAAPLALCRDTTLFLDAAGTAILAPEDIDGGSTVAIGTKQLTASIDSFDCTEVGLNLVMLYVTDGNGSVDSCLAQVTIRDTLAPEAMLQDITVYLDSAGVTSITASDLDAGSSDACGIDSMGVDLGAFDCENLGPNPVIVTLTDVNGNIQTEAVMVTVADTIAPVASCQDLTILLDSTTGIAVIEPSMIDAGSADNCGIMSLSLSQDTFSITEIGNNEITLTVVDSSGNSNSCTATVTVEGTTSIEDLALPEVSLAAHPNPTAGTFQIQFDSPWRGEVFVTIINTWGQSVIRKTIAKQADQLQTQFDLRHLPGGVYILQLKQFEYVSHMRIVKE